MQTADKTYKHPDQKYIEALLNNDKILLDELYQKFSGKIKWMVLQNNGTVDDAADIFQDALLYIFQKASNQGFILDCPLEGYLYLICKNKWINELKKRKFSCTSSIDNEEYQLVEDSFKLAEETLLKEQRLNLLLEKLTQISKKGRKLIYLSWSGKSLVEVAQVMGLKYGYTRKKKAEYTVKLARLVKESSQFHFLQL